MMIEKAVNIGLKELAIREKLSVRAFNVCKYNDLSDLEKVFQYFLKYGGFHRLRNCGKTTNTELIRILVKYRHLDFQLAEQIQLAEKKANVIIQKTDSLVGPISSRNNKKMLVVQLANFFSFNKKSIATIFREFDLSDGIPIFKIIHFLVEGKYIFTEKEKLVFDNTMCFFKGRKMLTLQQTGNKLGISRERVRQIREKILTNFDKYFIFIGSFDRKELNLYHLETTSFFLNIDQSLVEIINKTESVEYNISFINRVLLLIFKNKFSLVGNEANVVLGKKQRKKHNWNSTFLVSKQIHSIFDFDKLVDDVYLRLSKKITERYKFPFNTYLLKFKKADCIEFLPDIYQIAEEILHQEFGITIDAGKNIVFKRNSNRIADYVFEVLNEANTPLSVYDILKILNQQYPDFSKGLNAIRCSCQNDTRFICFGRSSTYGLKTWEKKFKNIKGGTMHDISEEFLLTFDTPKHIGDIAEYVSNFRKNVISSILFDNLKSAEGKRFVFFRNRHIGLISKKYDSRFPRKVQI